MSRRGIKALFAVAFQIRFKSLCKEPEVASRFVTFLARKALDRVKHGKSHSASRKKATRTEHREMMSEALTAMETWQRGATATIRRDMEELLQRMQAEQNEHRNIPFGSVRIITESDLLLFEYALRCLLSSPPATGSWAYQTARHYAERYDASRGTGLIPESLPLVQDIVEFWMQEFDLSNETLHSSAKAEPAKNKKPASTQPAEPKFCHRQGQFLAFIHLYWRLHRQGPAETDMVRFFHVTPPSAHDMVVRLEALGLVTREAGVPRSVRVAIPEEDIPAMEPAPGPAW